MKNDKPIRESLSEYLRGIAGGLLFSFPLLYTMEVWHAGFIASPEAILAMILLTGLILLGYNRYAGMHPDASWGGVFIDSIEELGIGIFLSFLVLLILNRINPGGMGVGEIAGKVAIAAMAVSIGVSIGTAQLGADEESGQRDEKDAEGDKNSISYRDSKLAVATLAVCGGIVVGGNVAPTEEILQIAAKLDPFHILGMIIGSLTLSIATVFFAKMHGSMIRRNGGLYHLVFETCICYLIALTVSAFLLWFFGSFDGAGLELILSQCIVLGVLTSLGSSAGRLLIK